MSQSLNLDPENLKVLQEKSKEIEQNMQAAQRKLLEMEQVGEAGAGLIKITMNGRYEATKVTLDPLLLKEPITVIEELIAAAINDTTQKVGAMIQGEMAKLIGGFGNFIGTGNK